jgi:2-polyprenyl-6-methoxyphenol hydroxylase-like FAD-dependent oxidoreductase
MLNCVVVGAGLGGLAGALALGRAGHRVAVIESDEDRGPEDPDAAFLDWRRPGTPQARLAHGFVARGREVLLGRTPDLLAAALASGINELDMTAVLPPGTVPGPGDESLVALASRRATLELVLRRAVEREPDVTIEVGRVTGLAAGDGTPPTVSGVLLDGRRVEADLVVIAAGRGAPVPEWLRRIGAAFPEELSEPAAVAYYGRFYRVRPGERLPVGRWIFGPRGDAGYLGFVAHRADRDVFSLTFWTPPGDEDLKALRHEAVLEAAVAQVPAFAPWRGIAEPIGPVGVFGSAWNRHRRFVRDSAPIARHLAVLGDSRCHTDPADGLGGSMAFVQAFALADATRTHRDVDDALLEYESQTEPLTRDVYDSVVGADRVRRIRYSGGAGAPDDLAWTLGHILPAAGSRDAEIMRAFLRRASILDRPSLLARRDDLIERAKAIFASLPAPSHAPGWPPRDEFVARLREAAPL